jgi:hypothetical protein
MRNILFILSLFMLGNSNGWAGTTKGAFHLEFAPNTDTSLGSVKREEFLTKINSALPPKLKDRLNQKIILEFVARRPHRRQLLARAECLSNGLGLKRQNRIQLDSFYLQPELPRQALAMVIHELAHAYDFSETAHRGIISSDRLYDKLTGWSHRKDPNHLFVPHWFQKNRKTDRSPDPREFANKAETFAVNLTYFMLDPEYACRRPIENEYFETHFEFKPFPNSDCQIQTEVNLHRLNSDSLPNHTVDLNPERIYQIHYLDALPNKTLSSHWGHSMFRVVGCAPERAVVGPDCLKDLKYHTVLSYRANVFQGLLKPWHALNGYYRSIPFLYSLPEILDEYVREGFRNVLSTPLRLTEEQKKRFINLLLQQYWEYEGLYLIANNNCATELFRFLEVVFQDERFRTCKVVTPENLRKKLDQFELSDPRSEDKSRGLYFPSQEESLKNDLNYLKEHAPFALFPWVSLEDYKNQSTLESRTQALAAVLRHPEVLADLSVAYSHAYALESWLLLKKKRALETLEFKFLQDLKKSEAKASFGAQRVYQPILDKVQATYVETAKRAGYGIPLKSLNKNAVTITGYNLSPESFPTEELRNEVSGLLQQRFQAERSELELLEANMEKISRLRTQR